MFRAWYPNVKYHFKPISNLNLVVQYLGFLRKALNPIESVGIQLFDMFDSLY